jgi:hypothetical protein
MTRQPAPHAHSAPELKAILAAERAGRPFLLWRDTQGVQQIYDLGGRERVSIGRRTSNDIVLDDDEEVSRAHALLELMGEDWALSDEGLSLNGSFVNDKRISGRRRLADGDVLRFGRRVVEYRRPAAGSTTATSTDSHLPTVESLTETQRRILVALCRPYKVGKGFATPAGNKQIAAEVFLSVDSVKRHLNALFRRFELSELPQNQKRARLVECAFQWGLVSTRDL